MATATERARAWRVANPERWKAMRLKSVMKRRSPCRACNKEIPFPKMGGKYCSIECRKAIQRLVQKKKRFHLREELNEFKCQQGCLRCGYDKHGAALDFHHADSNKERRITIGSWKTSKGMAEIAKCVILCANCHRVVHHHEDTKDVY